MGWEDVMFVVLFGSNLTRQVLDQFQGTYNNWLWNGACIAEGVARGGRGGGIELNLRQQMFSKKLLKNLLKVTKKLTKKVTNKLTKKVTKKVTTECINLDQIWFFCFQNKLGYPQKSPKRVLHHKKQPKQ